MVSLFHLHPFPSMFGHLTWQTKTMNTTCPCILELQCLLITIAKSTPIRRSSTCYGYTLLSFMSASTYYAQNNYLFLPFNFCFVFSISLRQRKKKDVHACRAATSAAMATATYTDGLGLADDVDARSFSRVRDADLCVVHCLENMCRDFR